MSKLGEPLTATGGHHLDNQDRVPLLGARAFLHVAFGTTAVAAAYFLAARLSLALIEPSNGVAVFWPAAGVASGLIIALGPAARLPIALGVMLATMAANLLGDRNLPASIVFALCNAGEALLIAWLVNAYVSSNFTLDTLRNVLGLLAAIAVGTAVSGNRWDSRICSISQLGSARTSHLVRLVRVRRPWSHHGCAFDHRTHYYGAEHS